MQVSSPDEIVTQRPERFSECQQPLERVSGRVKERRQVHDLPQMRLLVREHQVEEVWCPACQHLSVGHFPTGVEAPVQYGLQVQALAVYLYQAQLVPMARTCEVLAEVCHCDLSEGTLMNWVQQVSARVEPVVAQIAEWVSYGRLQHADETGVRIGGKLHWLHVNSTRWLTHLAWRPKRGKPALETIGIWPLYWLLGSSVQKQAR